MEVIILYFTIFIVGASTLVILVGESDEYTTFFDFTMYICVLYYLVSYLKCL